MEDLVFVLDLYHGKVQPFHSEGLPMVRVLLQDRVRRLDSPLVLLLLVVFLCEPARDRADEKTRPKQNISAVYAGSYTNKS